MKLYHVSRNNKNKPEIDMSQTLKNDMCYIHFLIDVMKSFNEFYKMYNSPLAEQYSKERGWSKEKIATEAIFEYVRFTEYETNPSRMIYTYFTDSIEKAKAFNADERENDGDYFSFEADVDKIYYYDMDVFHQAVKALEIHSLTEETFETILKSARKYWPTSKEGNTEILYKGNPVLKNITASVKKESV